MTTYTLEDADRLIEAEDIRWFDYCANVGHTPDNVAHMPSVRRDFVDYLNEDT